MMREETTGFLSVSKNQPGTDPVFYRLFKPKEPLVTASLLLLHGMQEHSGRYIEMARYFCDQGFVVLTYDHAGHGKTAQKEEAQGFFQLNKPAQRLVDDAEFMAHYLAALYPQVPHFVLGHSMGSFILRVLLAQTDLQFAGAIIVGSGGKNPVAGIAKWYLALQNSLSPRKRSKFFNGFFVKLNNSRFKNEPMADSTSWLSRSRSNREAFLADPLNGVPFTYNGFYAVVTLNLKATKRSWAKPLLKSLPLLFVSGNQDPIGNFGKGVRQTVENLKKDGFTDITLKLYEGMRHEILNEDIRQQVYEDILHWLQKRFIT